MSTFQEKKPAFARKLNGYSMEEVDSYIVPLLARQSALAQENDSLKKQLLDALKALQPAKENAEKLRNAANQAQAQADQIIAQAKQQAEFLVQSARQACNAELEQFRATIKKEAQVFVELRNIISQFHARTMEQYRAQVELMQKNAQQLGTIQQGSEEEFVSRILENVRADLQAREQRQQEQEQALRRAEIRTAMRTEQYVATDTQGESKHVVWTDRP